MTVYIIINEWGEIKSTTNEPIEYMAMINEGFDADVIKVSDGKVFEYVGRNEWKEIANE